MNHSYGLQLYSVRDFTEKDLAATLKKVADIGYKSVEFAGFFGHSAEEVRAMLDEYGLTCAGTHSGWEELRPTEIMETIRFHKILGTRNYVLPGADLDTLEKIDEFAGVMNYAKPILEAEGIRLAYHNHSDEFYLRPWGSTIHSELEKRLICDFEIDTYWVWNADADPLQTLERLKDRVHIIHLKDGQKGGIGCALGEGAAPVKAVRDKAASMGISMIVESEGLNPDGLAEVGRCMAYLTSID
ncbi:MAG: sugar phosphate isomerase/epimerase [Clostridia bacterium]|nr:sugar phosphate isomerase/epimerase [Clostridia bacterium]